MSKEFRPVHAAREALEIYNKTNSLAHLISIPIESIDRYDVWRCVFEQYKDAYKILQDKELRALFIGYSCITNTHLLKTIGTLVVSHLMNIRGEDKQPYALSVKDALDIIVDCIGNHTLPYILKAAEWSVSTRRNIIRDYFEKDNEWVGFAVEIKKEIEKYIENLP